MTAAAGMAAAGEPAGGPDGEPAWWLAEVAEHDLRCPPAMVARAAALAAAVVPSARLHADSLPGASRPL
jgi:hypothetical protein